MRTVPVWVHFIVMLAIAGGTCAIASVQAQERTLSIRNACAESYPARLAEVRRSIHDRNDYSNQRDNVSCANDDTEHRRRLVDLSGTGTQALVALDVYCFGDYSAECMTARESISAANERMRNVH